MPRLEHLYGQDHLRQLAANTYRKPASLTPTATRANSFRARTIFGASWAGRISESRCTVRVASFAGSRLFPCSHQKSRRARKARGLRYPELVDVGGVEGRLAIQGNHSVMGESTGVVVSGKHSHGELAKLWSAARRGGLPLSSRPACWPGSRPGRYAASKLAAGKAAASCRTPKLAPA
jgi:hypothetical protein